MTTLTLTLMLMVMSLLTSGTRSYHEGHHVNFCWLSICSHTMKHRHNQHNPIPPFDHPRCISPKTIQNPNVQRGEEVWVYRGVSVTTVKSSLRNKECGHVTPSAPTVPEAGSSGGQIFIHPSWLEDAWRSLKKTGRWAVLKGKHPQQGLQHAQYNMMVYQLWFPHLCIFTSTLGNC